MRRAFLLGRFYTQGGVLGDGSPAAPEQGRGAPVSSSGLSRGPDSGVRAEGGSQGAAGGPGRPALQAAHCHCWDHSGCCRCPAGAKRRTPQGACGLPPGHSRAQKGRTLPPETLGPCPRLSEGWESRALSCCGQDPWLCWMSLRHSPGSASPGLPSPQGMERNPAVSENSMGSSEMNPLQRQTNMPSDGSVFLPQTGCTP